MRANLTPFFPLDFRGVRWPQLSLVSARAEPFTSSTFGGGGEPEAFVGLVVRRSGQREWIPAPGDATWRSIAGLRLGDVPQILKFLRFRGDLGWTSDVSKGVNTVGWWLACDALRLAARA